MNYIEVFIFGDFRKTKQQQQKEDGKLMVRDISVLQEEKEFPLNRVKSIG